MANPEAIIADDEEQLRIHLKSKLAELWPELIICGEAKNGLEAMDLIELYRPAIAFLDIKMPGLSGIEVAQKISANCRVVFITAFDQYAVKAFENEAVDYLLKPVTDKRLAKTIKRLKKQISAISKPPIDFSRTMDRLLAALKDNQPGGYLKWIKVRHGEELRLISIDEVCYFKAADKYTLVRTLENESLIKKVFSNWTQSWIPINSGASTGAALSTSTGFPGSIVLLPADSLLSSKICRKP